MTDIELIRELYALAFWPEERSRSDGHVLDVVNAVALRLPDVYLGDPFERYQLRASFADVGEELIANVAKAVREAVRG